MKRQSDERPISSFYDEIAAAIGDPRRVWCRICVRSELVDPAEALANGWPKCHGQTMTIDEPETWNASRALATHEDRAGTTNAAASMSWASPDDAGGE